MALYMGLTGVTTPFLWSYNPYKWSYKPKPHYTTLYYTLLITGDGAHFLMSINPLVTEGSACGSIWAGPCVTSAPDPEKKTLTDIGSFDW